MPVSKEMIGGLPPKIKDSKVEGTYTARDSEAARRLPKDQLEEEAPVQEEELDMAGEVDGPMAVAAMEAILEDEDQDGFPELQESADDEHATF